MFVARIPVLVAVILGSAAIAGAQTSAAVQPAATLSLAADTFGSADFDFSAAGASAARAPLPPRGYFIRGFGGLWTSAGSGFEVGAGVAALPFANRQHEIVGNAALLHVEGANGLGIDVDYQYNFILHGGQEFTPYAGAGIGISHFSGGTDSGLQIGGGIKKPLSSGHEFFGEIYFSLTDSSPVLLRAGLSW
jgi:hypothetical protein